MKLPTLIAIGVGGALGTLSRWGVFNLLSSPNGTWSWATIVVNLGGALLIGFVLALVEDRSSTPRVIRPLVGIGFLGGFTTESTLSVGSDLMINHNRVIIGLAFIFMCTLLGVISVFSGAWLGKILRRSS